MCMLDIRNISMVYGEREILRDVSLSLEEKSIVVITGKSGSGKSTLLGILSGLLKPHTGTVFYNGQDIFQWGDFKRARFRNRTMGFVFQFFNLFPEMTAYENILYPASLNRNISVNVYKEIEALVELLGIGNIIRQYPATLSGGERQRVAIARAVVNNPKIILADEPTGNLDGQTTRDIISLFLRLKEERGITTILATHEKEFVKKADATYTIEGGELIKQDIEKPAAGERHRDRKRSAVIQVDGQKKSGRPLSGRKKTGKGKPVK